MIILFPIDASDKADKLDAPPPHPLRTPSNASLGSIPPPVHPALQYSVATPSPPIYQATRKPLASVTYNFRPDAARWNSMVLEAPQDLEGPYPSYHITVTMNCFTPTSHITTIRRGTTGDGEIVGDFETGLTTSRKSNTVFIRDNEHALSDILKPGYNLFRNHWYWKTAERERAVSLFWDDTSPSGIITCFSSKDRTSNTVLARFIPPIHLRRAGRPAEMNRLEVSPQGHDVFDDILVSALIIERIRTTPQIPKLLSQ